MSKTAATVSPPRKAKSPTIAYQLWLNNGCPVGSDQEDWFRAEAMLKNAIVAKCKDLSRRPSIPRCETRTESEMVVEFRWEGHWEAWELNGAAPAGSGIQASPGVEVSNEQAERAPRGNSTKNVLRRTSRSDARSGPGLVTAFRVPSPLRN